MRILLLTHWFPYPPDNGTRLRIFHLLQGLREHATLDLLTLAHEEVSAERIAEMERWCDRVEVLRAPEPIGDGWHALTDFLSLTPRSLRRAYSPAFAAAVARAQARIPYDAVLVFELAAAVYGLQLDAPLRIIDGLELALVHNDIARQPGALRRARARLAFAKHVRYCGQIAARYDLTTVVSTLEQEHLRAWTARPERVQVLPNGFAAELLERPVLPGNADSLIYAGALSFSANYDAVQWFLAEIYPRIRQALPGVSFTVTGKTEGVALDMLQLDASVRLPGWVPDIHALVAESALSVVPLRMGGGTRLKILESMALGTPVISTTKGAEGLEVVDGTHLVLADDPAAFAAAVVRLLHAPDERARLAAAARAFVQEHHDWPQIVARLATLMEAARAGRLASAEIQP